MHVKRAAEVADRLPEFEVSNAHWETKIISTWGVLGKVRMIAGSSLRADCRRHKPHGGHCKMHCDIRSRWEELDALMGKWLVCGSCMTEAEHGAEAQRLMAAWRNGEPC